MVSSASNLADETITATENEMEDEGVDKLTDGFQWTAATIVQSVVVFCLAGCAEILGGWLVWAAVRGDSSTTGKKPWWYALVGSVVLVICEFRQSLCVFVWCDRDGEKDHIHLPHHSLFADARHVRTSTLLDKITRWFHTLSTAN